MPASNAPRDALSRLRDAEWLRHAYLHQGRSRRDIAAELGVAGSTVGEWLTRHGIATRDATTAREAVFARSRPAELSDPDWLSDRYYTQGLSLEAIGTELGVAASTVRAAMDRHGLRTKTDRLRDARWLADAVARLGADGVAAELGVTDPTVRRWMARHGLTDRPRGTDPTG